MINSLAYCTQAVLEEAQAMAGVPVKPAKPAPPPFEQEDLRRFLLENAARLATRDHPVYQEIAASLERLASEADTQFQDLEDLERRLTVLQEKVIAAARSERSEEQLVQFRRDMDRALGPYRGKMTADQLAMLERNYLDGRLLEALGLPRLSLFYLR